METTKTAKASWRTGHQRGRSDAEGGGISRGGGKNPGDVRVRARVLPWTASELRATVRPIAERDGLGRGVPRVGLLSLTFCCGSRGCVVLFAVVVAELVSVGIVVEFLERGTFRT